MKNKGIILALSISLASVGLATVVLGVNRTQEAEASSYSVNSVPTTLDLNDTSAANIRSYYSGLNSLSTNERQGTNLLKNLKPILKNGQKYYSYGSSATTAVWQIYEIIDRDWEKSPASAISGYNSSTKIVTGYTYGTSNSNVGTNPYIHALYVNRNVTNETRAWGNHNQDQWGINQEHIWAKSCGFNDNSPAAGARGDVMHLWAGNGRVNGTNHSNYYYGYVDTSKSYDDAGSYASTLSGNRKGYSKTKGGTYTVFEPQDSDKGDIARAIFYMAARYNYLSGSDSDGIDAGNPNLEIVNQLNWAPGSSYTSTTSKKGQMGILQDLLEWNRIDPPDEWEIHRNNLCYNNFTKNRNPFIDFPEWAEFIWGKSTNGSYSSTSTGYATPSSDSINTFSTTPATKTLSSISVSGAKTSFTKGDSFTFGGTVTAHYSDSTTANVTSSATFSGYNMSTTGNQTVTVSYTEGGVTKTTTYSITVSESSSSVSSETITMSEQGYGNGAEVSSINGSNCTITFAKGTGSNPPKYYTGGTAVRAYAGNTITISSTTNIVGITITFGSDDGSNAITVNTGTFSSPSWTGKSNEVVFTIGGSSGNRRISAIEITYESSASSVTLSSITLDTTNVNKTFTTLDTFSYSGLVVTAHYSDNSSSVISSGYTVSSPNMSTTGNKTITVSYTEGGVTKSATYQITVNAPVPSAIYASVDKSFKVGETITKSDITLTNDIGETITDFTFSSYMFTYDDAASGGELTDKVFNISYNDSRVSEPLQTELTVEVQREAPESIANVPNTFTPANFVSGGVSESSSNRTTGNATINGLVFYLSDTYVYNGSTISLSASKTSAPGYFYNETAFATPLVNVTVTKSSGLLPNVRVGYKDNGEYVWTLLAEADFDNINYYYFKIDYTGLTLTSFTNLTGITVERRGVESISNFANYIMFEYMPNQCTTKFSVAMQKFGSLSLSDRNTFMTSNDYVVATARERFEAWARNQGKRIQHVNGDYVVKAPSNLIFDMIGTGSHDSSLSVVIIAGILGGAIALGSYLIIKRKKHE